MTRSELAIALNLSERRVSQLVREGMPQTGRNTFDFETCARWYIAQMQAALTAGIGGRDTANKGLLAIRIARTKANADRLELGNREAREGVLLTEDAQTLCDNAVRAFHVCFDGFHRRFSGNRELASRIRSELRLAGNRFERSLSLAALPTKRK